MATKKAKYPKAKSRKLPSTQAGRRLHRVTRMRAPQRRKASARKQNASAQWVVRVEYECRDTARVPVATYRDWMDGELRKVAKRNSDGSGYTFADGMRDHEYYVTSRQAALKLMAAMLAMFHEHRTRGNLEVAVVRRSG